MGFYVPCGHALCIHGEDLFLHVLCYRILVLFDELGLVFAVTVTGDSHFHVPVTGVHGLLEMSIAAVVGFLVPVIVL